LCSKAKSDSAQASFSFSQSNVINIFISSF
jgi:hypothetical protein